MVKTHLGEALGNLKLGPHSIGGKFTVDTIERLQGILLQSLPEKKLIVHSFSRLGSRVCNLSLFIASVACGRSWFSPTTEKTQCRHQ